MSSNLAVKLRSGTEQSHSAAENVGFVKCFLKGVVDRDCFAKLLGNLYYVYSELEAAIQSQQNHPLIHPLYFPELNRKASLEKDLEFYYGKNWRSQVTSSKATQTYIARIREVTATEPFLLLGHAYTRYMGDLSGGQMFQKVAQSALKLSDYEGTSFYNFEQIPDKKAFKDKYRQALNALPIDDVTVEKIVAEANHAFRLNLHVAQELEGNLIAVIGQVMFNTLTQSQNGSTEAASAK
ncbi:MAG: heme oxygenase (biliverdin-producing) [Rhizonema sp. NSF051]|nr:heme oxygenase (biliverdin-producing) [Rhizonema sp. NSF051]